jgi:hypothetical protein
VEDATYWLLYLDSFKERLHRTRTARRLLIGSAEDGHSIAVMEQVVENFSKISKPETDVRYLVEEAVRICKISNWWHPNTSGPDYIYSGMLGQRMLAYLSGEANLHTMSNLIEKGIDEQNKTLVLAGIQGLSNAKMGGTKQATLVLSLAKKNQHPLAERLVEVHLRAKSALAGDNNFLCQAVWMMAGGGSPVSDSIQPVSESEVADLVEEAEERWKDPRPIPGWCCDGTHSAGNDVRFMGDWPQMFSVCLAFEHYGRIDPADEWLPQFRCLDGLLIQDAR